MSSYMDRYQMVQKQKLMAERNGKKIKLRWNTPTEIRRSLARVNNMVLNNELTAKEANSIYYSANMILKAIELEKSTQQDNLQIGKGD